jgi:hypothetical protein
MPEESQKPDIRVHGFNIYDKPVYEGPAKCVSILDGNGNTKILLVRISDTVWGTVTNADADFKDWMKRYGVDR